jgi:hypothetical protein
VSFEAGEINGKHRSILAAEEKQLNPHVEAILSLLGSLRGLRATAVTTNGTDNRLYVQVVGVPGFPVFAINPTGRYDLPFEHSYSNESMTRMGLPILAGKPEGLNAVLFADKLAVRPRNRHDMCVGFDPSAIERVRQMAVMEAPHESWKIWRESGQSSPCNATIQTTESLHPSEIFRAAAASASHVSVPQGVRPQDRPVRVLRSYFESEDGQKHALEACCNFLGAKDWAVGDRLKLYSASRHAFGQLVPQSDALKWFRQIYDELVRPARAGGWGIARNAAGPLWSAEKTFQTIKDEYSEYLWGGPVTLLNFHDSSTQAVLVASLEKMRAFKPVANYPVMAVSKVLHFYNPELFPVYDNEVIWNKVLKHFKNEFREFCSASSPPYDGGDTPILYRNYMCWGAALLASAHSRFMEMFEEWLAKQPQACLTMRSFDASRLFATAYEFMIIGAYADSVE